MGLPQPIYIVVKERAMEQIKLYSIRLYLEPDPSGVYTITSPDVPGLVTEGPTSVTPYPGGPSPDRRDAGGSLMRYRERNKK